ncbi:sensor histidine kinase [Caulobacter sp. 17J80-11]|uniref:sensor histidine kinase n=1 Tax=Caulobacter sp. 17J80-11 TaxID=2763502 RepID=UPI001653D0BA|nr:histidine kinase dimerization/phosphoacceptor domain -containing protein [Caulobacter sp. 17J80-11]MBC6983560.1 PAS domain-containing protein [Caulobacter sp. 17J80-11]
MPSGQDDEKRKLEAAERRGGAFVEAAETTPAPLLVLEPAPDGDVVIYANTAFTTVFGYDRAEIVGRSWRLLHGPGTDPEVARRLDAAVADGNVTVELELYAKGGRPVWVSQTVAPVVEDGRVVRRVSSLVDVTASVARGHRIEELAETLEARVRARTARLERTLARLKAEVERRRSAEHVLRDALADNERHLAEKGALAQEIDHRAKNAIQLVMSLLQAQAGRTESPETRAALKTAIERLAWVAEAHAMLYQGEDPAHIEVADYLARLAPKLIASMESAPQRIDLQIDADDAFWPPDLVVPIGLITSEAITNAMKYAFPGGRPGRLKVSLRVRGSEARITIADDGVGPPEGAASGGLGLRLIEVFAKQIHGEAKLAANPGGGAALEVRFECPE